VRKVPALVTDMSVNLLQISDCFLSVLASAFTAGNLTLRSTKFGLGFLVISRVIAVRMSATLIWPPRMRRRRRHVR
jgi:hypothetical protein